MGKFGQAMAVLLATALLQCDLVVLAVFSKDINLN